MKTKFVIVIFVIILSSFLFTKSTSAAQTFTKEDVATHNNTTDCYMIFENKVYDITSYLSQHDQYYMNINSWCGKDMTEDFKTKAGRGQDHRNSSYQLLYDLYVGDLVESVTTPSPTPTVTSTNITSSTTPTVTNTTNQNSTKTIKSHNPYNFWLPWIATFGTYMITWFLMKKKIIPKPKFQFFWNTIMVFLLLPSVLFGTYLVLKYQFPDLSKIKFDFLYWHVEGSVAFSTLVMTHFLMRWTVYLVPLRAIIRKWRKRN